MDKIIKPFLTQNVSPKTILERLKKLNLERHISAERLLSLNQSEKSDIIKTYHTLVQKVIRFYLSEEEEYELIHGVSINKQESITLGNILTISGPSGVGKDSLIDLFMERNPKIQRFISATTREARPNEIKYHFITKNEFEFLQEGKLMIDRFDFVSASYGIPKSELKKRKENDVLVDVVPASAKIIKSLVPSTKIIIIMPPGNTPQEREAEINARLTKRNTETEEVIKKRILGDRDNFSNWEDLADYTIISETGKLSDAAQQLENIINA